MRFPPYAKETLYFRNHSKYEVAWKFYSPILAKPANCRENMWPSFLLLVENQQHWRQMCSSDGCNWSQPRKVMHRQVPASIINYIPQNCNKIGKIRKLPLQCVLPKRHYWKGRKELKSSQINLLYKGEKNDEIYIQR